MEGIWLLTIVWLLQLLAVDPSEDTLWWAQGGGLYLLHGLLRLG